MVAREISRPLNPTSGEDRRMSRYLCWLLLAGCADEWFLNGDNGDKDADDTGETDADADSDGDSDADTDGDSDGDTDADTDGDTDSDSDSDSDLECDEPYETPAPGQVAECITQEVFCGDVVYGTLEGGSTDYDYDYWLYQQELDSLLGEYDALDGPERVYLFRGLDPDEVVRATFTTCFDLWANWILFGDTGDNYCSLEGVQTSGVFESGTGHEWYTERINQSAGSYDFEFIVEGLYGEVGNFVLTIECF
jgi:hypothetical protein